MSGFTAVAAGERRAGSRVLSVFESPLNTKVLRAHADGAKRLAELQEKIGWSAPSTLRSAVGHLCEIGALTRRHLADSSYGVATGLSPFGEEMLLVADEIDAWLALCPTGAIPPGGEAAKVAVKALAGGWNSSLIQALAGAPHTLAELSELIPDLSYPALERRLSWMRSTGQIAPAQHEGRGTPYRHRLAAAGGGPDRHGGRCERRHLGEASPPGHQRRGRGRLSPGGAARSAAALSSRAPACLQPRPTRSTGRPDRRLAGVDRRGRAGRGRRPADAAIGTRRPGRSATPDTWLDAVIDGKIGGLRIGGSNPQLALDLVAGLHPRSSGCAGRSRPRH